MMAVGGTVATARQSSANAAFVRVLVVGLAGLLAVRVPRWWHSLRAGRRTPAGDRLLALSGVAALAGLVCGLLAELFHGPTRTSLNVTCLALIAFSVVGWAVLRTADRWRRRDKSPAPP
jgi:hypothetical protein